jgi:uncharacterized surface protein with fasciclin (FAS1) repeats
MASLFGTNNIFSTFNKLYPAPCESKPYSLADKVKSHIFGDIELCKDPECYSNSIELLEYIEMFNNMPITYFLFDNASYDVFYKDAIESEKRKIARAHVILGNVFPENMLNRILNLTTASRKTFYLDGRTNTIFKMENNYPIVYANIKKYTEVDNIVIYFIDSPLFSLEQLYIDTASV